MPMDPKQLADDMERRSDAVRNFYDEATGCPHIGITIMAHHAYVVPPNKDELAKRLVDVAQTRADPQGGAYVMKGRLADDTETHFVVVLIAPTRTAIVYLTHLGDDATSLCEQYKAQMGF